VPILICPHSVRCGGQSNRPTWRRHGSRRSDLRLFGRVELEAAGAHGLAGLHGKIDGLVERLLPRVGKGADDSLVVRDAGLRDLVPCAGVLSKRAAEAVFGARGALHNLRCLRRSAAERVREGLVLRARRRRRRRRGQVRTLEVCGGKVGDAGADGGTELGDRLLYLGGVVVRLVLVYPADPAGVRSSAGAAGVNAIKRALQEDDVRLAEGIDAILEIPILYDMRCAA
jgi:hypothetical protein